MFPPFSAGYQGRALGPSPAQVFYNHLSKGHNSYVVRALLTARSALVGIPVRLENEIRGLLKTFGVMFGKRVGGLMGRAE
jgi:hypothetical protein